MNETELPPFLFLLNDQWSVKPNNKSSMLVLACLQLGRPMMVIAL